MQYKIKLKFDLECTPEQDSALKEKITGVLAQFGQIKNLSFSCKKEKIALKTIAVFSPDEILQYADMTPDKRLFVVGEETYPVRMNSQRYFLFKTSKKCVSCGLEGTKMLLQKHPHDNLAHFNLFAEENGELILMTKDHIHAKSAGGEDRHTNYQTMCCICNNLKGSDDLSVGDISHLRKIYSDNINKLSKKALNKLLFDEKNKILKNKKISRRTLETGYFAKCDINVYQTDAGLIGMAVYDKSDGICIGCIPKDTKFYSLKRVDEKYYVPLNPLSEGEQFSVFEGLIRYIS